MDQRLPESATSYCRADRDHWVTKVAESVFTDAFGAKILRTKCSPKRQSLTILIPLLDGFRVCKLNRILSRPTPSNSSQAGESEDGQVAKHGTRRHLSTTLDDQIRSWYQLVQEGQVISQSQTPKSQRRHTVLPWVCKKQNWYVFNYKM
jgi:hypothetical protein